MRRSLAVILATATLGTMVAATGCAEHRYPTPYYNSPNDGYYGWNAAEQARYREWLAERQYQYMEFNRLSAERQREYWAWRNSHYGQRSVQDEYRNYNRERMERQRYDQNRRYDRDHDNRGYAHDRDHDNRYAHDRDNQNRVYQNHSRNQDHDRKTRDRDRDHDHDHDHR
ncbi:MAG TPA: hypothetical protein VFP59_18520 [Candidatus Angelobacter sp.]|nr:hypothetical protein [Candidatus Angelobacter sp.]